jgi:NADPH-dependent 2,4-dienoyl-CoA reductase/sulfur reductase-like enzyme
MKPLVKDFVIIGSGPAGLNAAIIAANLGVQVTIIDENTQIGGQIFRQTAPEISRKKHLDKQSEDTFEKLNQSIIHNNIKIYSSSTVWGIFEKEESQAQNNSEINSKIIATDNREIPLIEARNLLIASGAYEMPVIFPGWTIPGVITLGSMQILLKSQGVIPEGRIIIAGTGPFLYLSASQLIENGANVIGIVEASSMLDWYAWGVQLLSIMLGNLKSCTPQAYQSNMEDASTIPITFAPFSISCEAERYKKGPVPAIIILPSGITP